MTRSHQLAWTALTGVSAMLAFAQATTTPTPQPPQQQRTVAPSPVSVNRNVVVLDAAHGGIDSGSRIGDSLLEKDITLALAMRLRSLLTARGFTVVMTRDGETGATPAAAANLTLDGRVGVANRAQGAACLLLHATGAGTGVHLYASELEPVSIEPALTPWLTAQAAWVTESRALETLAATALQKANIAKLSNTASVRPLDSLACPAILVELAPENDEPSSVSDGAYQQHVAEALATALAGWPQRVQPPLRAPSASALRAAAQATAQAQAGVQP